MNSSVVNCCTGLALPTARAARPGSSWRSWVPVALTVPWRGHLVWIRYDNPKLEPYVPRGAVIGSAMHLASDVHGLELVPNATVATATP
jgi:hypothetical protein